MIEPTDVVTFFNLPQYEMVIAIIQSPYGKFKDLEVTYILD
jgi:hypothetical protein